MPNKKRSIEAEDKLIHVSGDVYKIPYRRKNGMPGNKYYCLTKCFVCSEPYYRDRGNHLRGGETGMFKKMQKCFYA